ncbi:helix-turn-helix domain-containing protein [Streptomyces sp. BA2]|uniref:helix-turn-helix domain-containing protein n=1 Tax=Streptomyces sp. BA2 TaxID=436595 RepID=UPI001325CE10|nr:helix-turn-helix transcriptional regulator [Streptomyces sp. BA2]MWA13080.1 helix-turn-helix domain-containing protein [Streptomyces sp. BA2]
MSAAWRPLPEALPPEVRHFVEQLRLLKDRTGLSLIALGKETAYSKSSWQRYLNAQQPPPRQAVAALCKVAGEDGERFCARWEVAVRAWPRGGAGGTEPAPGVVLSKAAKTSRAGKAGKTSRAGKTGKSAPPAWSRGPRRPSRARSAWTWRSTAAVTTLLVLAALFEGLLRFLMR